MYTCLVSSRWRKATQDNIEAMHRATTHIEFRVVVVNNGEGPFQRRRAKTHLVDIVQHRRPSPAPIEEENDTSMNIAFIKLTTIVSFSFEKGDASLLKNARHVECNTRGLFEEIDPNEVYRDVVDGRCLVEDEIRSHTYPILMLMNLKTSWLHSLELLKRINNTVILYECKTTLLSSSSGILRRAVAGYFPPPNPTFHHMLKYVIGIEF